MFQDRGKKGLNDCGFLMSDVGCQMFEFGTWSIKSESFKLLNFIITTNVD
jgi:hypothetical protein